MIEAFASLLIVILIAVGAFYASLRYHTLLAHRDMLAAECKRSEGQIMELEERVILLEQHIENNRAVPRPNGDGTGWDMFNARG